MKIENCTLDELRNLGKIGRNVRGKIEDIVTQFMLSESLGVKITYDPGEYKSSHSLQSSLTNAAKRLGYWEKLKVAIRGNEVYLVRADFEEMI